MTERKCVYTYCFAPDSPCNLGEPDFAECPHWKETIAKVDSAEFIEGSGLLPWSGNSFGKVDVEIISARSSPKIIGVLGAHDAGKTTLLTVLYLLVARGRALERRSFGGSYTLGGWENLATFLRWKDGQTPGFPPHTGSHAGRCPGLLHLAFRNVNTSLEDVLFVDAPGEWFAQWATNKTASGTENARWVSRFADKFLLFADSVALSGPQRGHARSELLTLAERLAEEAAGRPVAVVWSKSDVTVPEGISSVLKKRFRTMFSDHPEFSVSVFMKQDDPVFSEDAFIGLMNWLLSADSTHAMTIPLLPVLQKDDPLLAFRRQ